LLIFLNVGAVIIGTVEGIHTEYATLLYNFEVISVIIFTVEYLARLWSCVADSRFSKLIKGRLHFMVRPLSLIDLIAILPFYLPLLGIDLRFIRILRLLRILRVAKLGRYSDSLQLMVAVIRSKKEELILTIVVLLFLLVISSSLMYYAEHSVQPVEFSSIPATMWWSVVTLTTVGYGDAYPLTAVGKLIASVIAILGIGMFALPTGVIGAGFIEEIQKQKSTKVKCPHCGEEIN